MPYIKPDKTRHQYVLGIDFGHGETSADFCSILWDAKYGDLKDPDHIEIFKGLHAVKSVLLIAQGADGNEEVYIGNQAVNKYTTSGKGAAISFHSCFKKAPSLMSADDKRVMGLFMREVYRQIRDGRHELTDDNHLVYIACPSNPTVWSDEELKAYAEIASEAGLPLADINGRRVGLIRESRAAFIKALSLPEVKSSVKDGILLIDFGSSTVDLTYYSRSLARPIDDGGAECGASKVEMAVFGDLRKSDERVDEVIKANPCAETAMALSARDSKERFYKDDAEQLEVLMSLTKMSGKQMEGTLEHFYSDREIKEMLSGYVASVTRCFTAYRDKYLEGKPIKGVFLTGGASRMPFVEDVVKEVFGCEKGAIYRDPDPSLTISNGITQAGRADLRTYAMENALLSSSAIADAVIADKAADKAAAAAASAMVPELQRCFNDFAQSSSDGSIADLSTAMNGRVKAMRFGALLTQGYGDALRSVANVSILPQLNNIVLGYFPDYQIPDMKASTLFSLNIDPDDIAELSTVISDCVEKISEGFFGYLFKIIFNILAGLLAIYATFVTKVGTSFSNIFRDKPLESPDYNDAIGEFTLSFNDRNTSLSSSKRAELLAKFKEKKGEYRDGIRESVKTIITTDKALTAKIDASGRFEMKKYISEQIERARLMLN